MSTPVPDLRSDELRIRLPRAEAQADNPDQDQEWCEVAGPDGAVERIRFHDYDRIFEIPGLYEQLFYEHLRCCSPTVVREQLQSQLALDGTAPSELRVIDLGAGNGMVGEELKDMGAGAVVGVDILPEARMATERDRPDVYDDYLVSDLTDPSAATDGVLREFDATCLTVVAALGFGDIPPAAFSNSFGYLAQDSWVALTIKDDFVAADETSGFSDLLRRMSDDGALEIVHEQRYRHRLAVSGEPLHYHSYVGRKRGEVEETWLAAAEQTA